MKPDPEMFKQRTPCLECPFRKGGVRHPPEMQASYAWYFMNEVGASFPCHKSVAKTDDRRTWSAWQPGQVLCAGGLIFAAKHGKQNGLVRLAVAKGWYDPACHADADKVLIYDTMVEMIFGDRMVQILKGTTQ